MQRVLPRADQNIKRRRKDRWRTQSAAVYPAKQTSRRLPPDIQPKAFIKLAMLAAASAPQDLQSPPSNRFHELDRDRKGQYSISINMQWRICFGWSDGGATDVEITDYH